MSCWIKNLTITALAILLTVSCSTYRNVYSDYDKSIDFSQYTTFAWAPDSTMEERTDHDVTRFDNDIVRNNAKNYVSHALTQRGLLIDIESPDLVLELVLLNEKKELITYHTHRYMGYYYYSPFYFPYYYPYPQYYTWDGWGYYNPFLDPEARTVTKTFMKGTVIINMYDRKLQRLVWTGSAEGDIYDPSYIHFDVHPAIDRIIKEFPVKPIQPLKRNGDKQGKGIVRGDFRDVPVNDRSGSIRLINESERK